LRQSWIFLVSKAGVLATICLRPLFGCRVESLDVSVQSLAKGCLRCLVEDESSDLVPMIGLE
jgi:hypothetical protein